MPEIKIMKVEQLDDWWETNPPPDSIAYGIDENDKKYLAFVNGKEKPIWQPIEWFTLNKRQYTFVKGDDIYTVSTYYEGLFFEKRIFLHRTQAEKYITQLEEDGYEIAFTKEQFQEAKYKYDYIKDHRLQGVDYE